MKLTFEIDQTPPTCEQIKQAQRCIDKEIIRWKYVAAFMLFALMMVVGIARFQNHIFIVCFAACVGGVWGRVTQLKRELKLLEYLPGSSFPNWSEVLDNYKTDDLSEIYYLAVGKQDRPLMVAEARLIIKRMLDAVGRYEEEGRQLEDAILRVTE